MIGNPVFEWIQAAHYDGMPYHDFQNMPVEYREMIIAAMRTERQIESVTFADRMKKKK